MTILLLFALILLNGLFAMAEMALVSARKPRIREQANAGNQNARIALNLIENPADFLSTVQIGITLVGVGAGAIGGASIAQDLTSLLLRWFPNMGEYAAQISLFTVVVFTTYITLILGELVPKRLAFSNPDQIAIWCARPLSGLSAGVAPLVWFLSQSTKLITSIFGVESDNRDFITDYDVFSLMREGIHSGEFATIEQQMVRGALELDDTRVKEFMIPRTDIIWIDVSNTKEDIQKTVQDYKHSIYPVCDGDMDHVLGVVRSKDLLPILLDGQDLNVRDLMNEPIFVPETVIASEVLRHFRANPVHTALLIGEFGGVSGLITLNDIVEEVFGDVDMADPEAVQRADGSWLVDGLFPIDHLTEIFPDLILPDDAGKDYYTIAGFMLDQFGHIPQPTESFFREPYRFEVMDMDYNRIDKILVSTQNAGDDARPTKHDSV